MKAPERSTTAINLRFIRFLRSTLVRVSRGRRYGPFASEVKTVMDLSAPLE
jgi:hypothetical protein